MERAPLRPVPSRPPGPIAPAEALRYVTAELPALDEPAAGALALVALVGKARHEVAEAADPPGVADLSGEALAEALARARKALRRRLYPLPGSGWCERAERLISDRLDDAIEDPGPARLEVHLANCGRCVEHERRLAQSQDSLVAGFVEAHPAPEPEPEIPPPGTEVVVEAAEAPSPAPLLRAVKTPALPPGPDPEALPAVESPPEALPAVESPPEALPAPDVEEPARLDGQSGEPGEGPARLEGQSGEPAEQAQAAPEPRPPAAVPAAWRRSSATLWSPAAPSPPRVPPPAEERPTVRAPTPVAPAPPSSPPVAVAPVAAPTVPSTPPPAPPSDPPPSAPSASSWTSQPSHPYTPPPPGANAWRSDAPRPALAARRALESESVWTSLGPLVAVLSVAVVLGVLAAMLAVGG